MTFRARLTLAFVALAALPVLLFGFGLQREMRARLDEEAAMRLDASKEAVILRLLGNTAPVQTRLEAMGEQLATDNRFRLALADEASPDRRWLLDWAGEAMRGSALAVLQLQDSTGRILSSGHFRNEFGRVAPALPRALEESAGTTAIVDARTPTGRVRALVVATSFMARGERFTLVGGIPFDSASVAQLSPDAAVSTILVTDDPPQVGTYRVIDSIPFLDDARGDVSRTALLSLVVDPAAVRALRDSIRTWLLAALGLTLALAILAAALIARMVAAPVAALSDRTARLDLDRLETRFSTGRDDEIGALERTLDALTGRLRTSVVRLREAERDAATGDLARQVNHDIKNGLAPIRNVLRHLAQVAEREPATLAATFLERRATLESSVEYLDTLARNYAKLSPAMSVAPIDVRPVILEVAQGVGATQVDVRLPDALPSVRADAIVLRRILDNLVSNAVDALEGKSGTITVAADLAADGEERRVRLTIADTGRGMTRAELARAFDDFHTTKPQGTGLGLSVVRRLLTDLGGSIRADTAPGEGTTFTIELPAA